MIGPRVLSVHPNHRRGRRLLPFLIALAYGPLACSNDQPTENELRAPATSTARLHPYLDVSDTALAPSFQMVGPKMSLTLAVAAMGPANGPKILVLADADGPSTTALTTSLSKAGYQVTSRPAPENTWDGSNPALTGFDAVIHLDGATWNAPLPPSAQTALNDFVQNGGGFVGSEWNGYEASMGKQTGMPNLVLHGYSTSGKEQDCGRCSVTYSAVAPQAGHPVLAGLPASFAFQADGHHAGPVIPFLNNPSTLLMRIPSGNAAVLVREFGRGKVVSFSFSANYSWGGAGRTLLDPNIQRLYLNAVRWTAGSPPDGDSDGVPDFADNCPLLSNPSQADANSNGVGDACEEAQPQSISFAALSGKTFGDPDFTVTASATSGLPVNFTAGGKCTISGATVHLTGAGSCSITAEQAGNNAYKAASPVSQSFAIAKGAAAITLSYPQFVFDGSAKYASVSTAPAGLSGLTVTYTLNGVTVAHPTNAGIYQALAHLEHPNYQAPDAQGTLTIKQATPALRWADPAPIVLGTSIGKSQLNASAAGVGGVGLSGDFAYSPAAGTMLGVGSHLLGVQFTPNDRNYTGATKAVRIAVVYRFSGFFQPVDNLPVANTVKAGSTVPVKFSLGGNQGLAIMQAGSPTSFATSCSLTRAGADDIEEIVSASTSGLNYTGNRYHYNWKTSASWAGSCRKLRITLVDGTTHEALFRLK